MAGIASSPLVAPCHAISSLPESTQRTRPPPCRTMMLAQMEGRRPARPSPRSNPPTAPTARRETAMDSSSNFTKRTSPQEARGGRSVRLLIAPDQRPGTFTARLDGEVIVTGTRQPVADGARILLDRGYAPDMIITMRHAGAAHDAFEPLPISVWSRWTYSEGDRDGLRKVRWIPRQLHEEGQKSTSAGLAAVRGQTAAESASAGAAQP